MSYSCKALIIVNVMQIFAFVGIVVRCGLFSELSNRRKIVPSSEVY